MAVLSKYAKQRIVALKQSGVTSSGIVVQILENEGITTSAQTVRRFYIRYCQSGSIARRRGSGRPTILTDGVLQTIDQTMRENGETTAADLQRFFEFHQHEGIEISLTTIQRGRRHLGWTFHGSAYCQLIRDVNKQKRLEWARVYLHNNFENVIWSDETSVQLETHKRFCCRKRGERPRPKPRPKHPVKVHVWAGIGWHGPTSLHILMNADLYIQVLQEALTLHKPVYASGHCFMQDNDPKHTSRKAWEFIAENGVDWWRTPPESPDSNPIENLWQSSRFVHLQCI